MSKKIKKKEEEQRAIDTRIFTLQYILYTYLTIDIKGVTKPHLGRRKGILPNVAPDCRNWDR